MQTRRKSVNLELLGIKTPRQASASHHRSPPESTKDSDHASPPPKRTKRSHTVNSTPSTSITSPTTATASPGRPRKVSQPTITLADRQKRSLPVGPQNTTPPPSPGHYTNAVKIDIEGIKDDIVIAVLRQLESTGNRPHQIKELAAVLSNTLPSVESSQNPVAIISSRLTNYLKRPWTVIAPCPLGKEQVAIHPRRVYYFLTNMPRQQIPEYADPSAFKAGRHIISPSISSGPDDEEEASQMLREQHSPSPEIDFSYTVELSQAQDLNDDIFASQDVDEDSSSSAHHIPDSRQGAIPPLEHDEHEFTQTASVMQQRKASEQAEQKQQQEQEDAERSSRGQSATSTDVNGSSEPMMQDYIELLPELDQSEEATTLRNQEAAAALFGHSNHHLQATLVTTEFSSPLLRPQQHSAMINNTPRKPHSITIETGLHQSNDEVTSAMFDKFGAWGDLKSPENVELAELDDWLGGY